MTEVYQKVGRGGAGNFYSKQDMVEANKNSDLESASRQRPTSNPSPASTAPAPEYLHTGRGGAGNWVQPSELASSGLAQIHPTSDLISTSKPAAGASPAARVGGSSKPTYRSGRGGAGNYHDLMPGVEGEEEGLPMESEERSIKLWAERQAQEAAERALMRPEKAYRGSGRSGRSGGGMDLELGP
ncbi:hypothetical protein QTJ16_000969 [Diplocarpon rosae]|uniref:Uncharacterized protein n=1 Tax=Diplocarpon rosae TaxID=946125 RepID=A0AAD9T7B9_9HELO|nr:hypothetical protein QTJ16_000969 [Diplocarpon rosae]